MSHSPKDIAEISGCDHLFLVIILDVFVRTITRRSSKNGNLEGEHDAHIKREKALLSFRNKQSPLDHACCSGGCYCMHTLV
jgi:hypothetical protein